MTTAVKSVPVQSQEELDAAEAEQIVPISREGLLKQRRYHKIQAMKKALDAELEDIKAFHEAEMKEKGAKALSYKGVVAVEMVDTTKVTNNYKGLFAKYPEIQSVFVSDFQTKEPSVRYDAKKPV
jgi:hypothetical protein